MLPSIKTALRKAFSIVHVAQRAFMLRNKRVEQVVPAHIEYVAHTMESLIIMAEDLPPETPLTIEVTSEQLCSFVCYMRQLDSEYRLLYQHNELNEGKIKDLRKRIDAMEFEMAELRKT